MSDKTKAPKPRKLARLDLDFSPARRNRPAGWLLLAAGRAGPVGGAGQIPSAQAARMALASDLSAPNARLNGTRPGAVRSGPPLDPRVSKAANQIARELQM